MFHSVFLFLDIGGGEIVLIMLVALLLFGGDKLPELARGLGKGIRDFKDASEGVKREIANQIENYEKKEEDKPVETPAAEALPEHTTETSVEPVPTHVPNTVPVSESYTATDSIDHIIDEKRGDDHHADPAHDSEPVKKA